jgi:hypothetical protein
MSSVRLNVTSLQKLEAILSKYNADTNPDNAAASKRNEGRIRFEKVLQMFVIFNGDLRIASRSEEHQDEIKARFLKDLCAFAHAEYLKTWSKSSEGLSAQLLMFVAQEMGIAREKRPRIQHFSPYAGPISFVDSEFETDEEFFKRVNERVNPTSPGVQRFLDATPMRSLTGIPVPAAQVAGQKESDAPTSTNSQESAVIFPRPGFSSRGLT